MLPGGQGAMGYINSVSMSTSEGGIEGGWLRRTQDFNISQQEAETSQGSDIYSLVTGSRKKLCSASYRNETPRCTHFRTNCSAATSFSIP